MTFARVFSFAEKWPKSRWRNSKSAVSDGVPVRVRPSAPQQNQGFRRFRRKPFFQSLPSIEHFLTTSTFLPSFYFSSFYIQFTGCGLSSKLQGVIHLVISKI
jgi:hypothetical protein